MYEISKKIRIRPQKHIFCWA